jgi:hypothetical protein
LSRSKINLISVVGLFLLSIIPNTSPCFSETIDKGFFIFTPQNYTKKETENLLKAQQKLNAVLASKCFSDFFLERELIQTHGKNNQGVIDFIRSHQGQSYIVKMYHKRFSKVVGYIAPPSKVINTNRKFHAGASSCAVASNIGHEVMHLIGFEHDFKATKRRVYSVPYSFNAMIDKCCK